MRDLNHQEISQVSGGYYDGNSIGDALGNTFAQLGKLAENVANAGTFGLFAPVLSAAYNVGEAITTPVVNIFNAIFGGKQYR
ncbi:hypothetical protein AB4037_33455 [Labrys sp. KB_33_2]|uniref:hypothetical protein n=1 Tax=Labrys sp. KB_33_2 TaxID=3237479 RepID=UPI003F935595